MFVQVRSHPVIVAGIDLVRGSDGGFRVAELFTDARQWFWVAWLEPA